MKQVIDTERLPIFLWLDEMEPEALQQAKNLANLPFAFRHIAIMPDSHVGYGMPIGGVLASEDVIVPNAVGVDIGCGMCSLKTSLREIDHDSLKNIMKIIRQTVPTGFNHHKEARDLSWLPELKGSLPVVESQIEKAAYQVGTLGGGNHFIEIQRGSDGHIWIMIHSGSRNVGFTVAGHYHELAKKISPKIAPEVPSDLSFFRTDVPEFQLYKNEMDYCIAFALSNRKLMMEQVKEAVTEVQPDVEFSDFINKPHNFASVEEHFGTKLIVHRKGATRAKKGELGMIPGSQGTSSYIVEGKGNELSFESCSHGAGRVMSRTKAKKQLSVKSEAGKMNKLGIIHDVRSKSDLDEAPGAYKNIDEVMRNQQDLIEIKIQLKPLAVIKG